MPPICPVGRMGGNRLWLQQESLTLEITSTGESADVQQAAATSWSFLSSRLLRFMSDWSILGIVCYLAMRQDSLLSSAFP